MLRVLIKPLQALPIVPLVTLNPVEVPLLPQLYGHGDTNAPEVEEPPEPDPPHQSPLTFGNVFNAIPRVTGVNTPNINSKIAEKWGLPHVQNSEEFRRSYVEGRDNLRYDFLFKRYILCLIIFGF